MTLIAGVLDEKQTQRAREQAQVISDAAEVGSVRNNQFVFLAAFDGTRNNRRDVDLSGNPLDTNVAQIFAQADNVANAEPNGNLKAGYYPGHGTDGTLVASDWYPGQVTQEAINTAQKAYKEFAQQASRWLKEHPDGEVTTAITAFSRGGATAAVFTHLLYRDGLIDPDTKQVLIPPGEVGVSAGVIFDPVSTGVNANVAFAPNVKNVAVIQAQNEYRYLFKGVDYSGQEGVRVLEALGNHCNIGGGYDNGLGALYLEAATRFLQRSGVQIADVDPARRPDPHAPLYVYDESDASKDVNFLTAGRTGGKWDVSAAFVPGAASQPARLLDKVATPASMEYLPEASVERFTLYNRQNLVKARSYQDDVPALALEKHPELTDALIARALVEKEIASMPQQSQAVILGRFDQRMADAIEKGTMSRLQVIEAVIPEQRSAQEAAL